MGKRQSYQRLWVVCNKLDQNTNYKFVPNSLFRLDQNTNFKFDKNRNLSLNLKSKI